MGRAGHDFLFYILILPINGNMDTCEDGFFSFFFLQDTCESSVLVSFDKIQDKCHGTLSFIVPSCTLHVNLYFPGE